MEKKKKIVIMGIGYVGLPLALILAKKGFDVLGVDNDSEKVESLNRGELYIQGEKELDKLFRSNAVHKNFRADVRPSSADVFIIAVPTPLKKKDKKADLSAVISATESICLHIKKGNVVIIESTVPPLTAKDLVRPIVEKKTGLKVGRDIHLVHCPERILPGNILAELIGNDRVIGGYTEKAANLAADIYRSFVKGEIYLTDDITAELCKLSENSYRDINIAFANELAQVCQKLGVNTMQLIELANKHPRVNILTPGIGVGGHCIPIDPWFVHQIDPQNSTMIKCSRQINDSRPRQIADKIRNAVKNIQKPKIILLGLSYKKDVDDLRESPALEVYHELQNRKLNVKAFDPLLKKYRYVSLENVIKDADCVAILVPHQQILADLNKGRVKRILRGKLFMKFD